MDISSRKDCKLFKINNKESRMNFIKSSLSLHIVLMPLLQTLIFKVCNKDTRTTLMTSIVCVFIDNFEKIWLSNSASIEGQNIQVERLILTS